MNDITQLTGIQYNEADIIIRSEGFAVSMISVFDSLWETGYNLNEFKKSLK